MLKIIKFQSFPKEPQCTVSFKLRFEGMIYFTILINLSSFRFDPKYNIFLGVLDSKKREKKKRLIASTEDNIFPHNPPLPIFPVALKSHCPEILKCI